MPLEFQGECRDRGRHGLSLQVMGHQLGAAFTTPAPVAGAGSEGDEALPPFAGFGVDAAEKSGIEVAVQSVP